MSQPFEREGSLIKRPQIDGNDSHASKGIAKIVNDPIHGHLELSPACMAVIDTKQFQRLRFIKQLGCCYFVYPGASHNRFEHSLGVCHLAGQLVRTLRNNQPELLIDEKDILCVELAGLCHDLGHGPFSHTFDGKFIPSVHPDKQWKHEKASIAMFDYLVTDNKLMGREGALTQNGLDDNDIIFIKEMIYGPLEGQQKNANDVWPYKGRPESKAFLYEIVSNQRTGIDVDKWDYIARDCHHLGIRNNFDHNRFVKFMRVLDVDGRLEMCSRDKEIGNLYQMFYTRYMLHRSAYQHKVNCAVEIMVIDAFQKADEHLKFYGKTGKAYCLSECIFNMEAYAQLTDHVLWDIFCSQKPELQPAQRIAERILTRDLYCNLDERLMSAKLMAAVKEKKIDQNGLRDQIIAISKSDATHPSLGTSDFHLQIVYLDFGMEESNPLENMKFYSKAEPNQPKTRNEKSLLKPPRFKDSLIRLYSCHRDSGINTHMKFCFEKFCSDWDMGDSTDPWDFSVYSTLVKRSDSINCTTPCSAGKAKGRISLS